MIGRAKFRVIFLVLSLILGLFSATTANAAACPPPKKDGKTIGTIKVGKTTVNVKNIDYPAGKDLDPPKSPLNVGLSIRHQPLASPIGSSLLVWHVNYNGCQGRLNVINDKKPGFTFKVKDENKLLTTYKVTEVYKVKKGKYKPEWFMLTGPRQLVMVTCTGKVVNRSYTHNLVIIAAPLLEV